MPQSQKKPHKTTIQTTSEKETQDEFVCFLSARSSTIFVFFNPVNSQTRDDSHEAVAQYHETGISHAIRNPLIQTIHDIDCISRWIGAHAFFQSTVTLEKLARVDTDYFLLVSNACMLLYVISNTKVF